MLLLLYPSCLHSLRRCCSSTNRGRPQTPHVLLGSALGLLLVFRTNTAYSRFWEGRKIWEQVATTCRALSRYSYLYERDIGKEKTQRVM